MTVSNSIKFLYVKGKDISRSFFVKRKTEKIWKNLKAQGLSKPERKLSDYSYLLPLKHSVNLDLISAYALISGKTDACFIPEDIYYSKVEPALNNRLYALAYADKNLYERYLRQFSLLFPEVLFRYMGGVASDGDYQSLSLGECRAKLLSRDGDYIAKPSIETSGGGRVYLLRVRDGVANIDGQDINMCIVHHLCEKLGENYIVQHRIRQLGWFEDFNKSSLNTIRLMTYRSVIDNAVHPISAVVRFGRPNSIVDNQASGGLTCGIDDKGMLGAFAVDKYGRLTVDLPWIATKRGTEVPGFHSMCNYAKEIAPMFPYHRLIGFDFCMDSSGDVKLIEINLKNLEINFLQMNNGALFGAYTEEIIDYCARKKRSHMIGFYA